MQRLCLLLFIQLFVALSPGHLSASVALSLISHEYTAALSLVSHKYVVASSHVADVQFSAPQNIWLAQNAAICIACCCVDIACAGPVGSLQCISFPAAGRCEQPCSSSDNSSCFYTWYQNVWVVQLSSFLLYCIAFSYGNLEGPCTISQPVQVIRYVNWLVFCQNL